jgi:hypothetical protein
MTSATIFEVEVGDEVDLGKIELIVFYFLNYLKGFKLVF